MVTGTRSDNLIAVLKARTHEILSGVPESLGGKDEGATPHEILEAALTACTIITVQMYANRKGIQLQSTNVQTNIVSENKEGTVIERKLTFLGDLSVEEKIRLEEIANKCPLHRLLSGSVTIKTSVV